MISMIAKQMRATRCTTPMIANRKSEIENEIWARQDSNLGPRDYESPALTAELQAHLPINKTICPGCANHSIDFILTLSASLAYVYAMKRPKLRVLPYRHSKKYPYYLDLRAFGKGRRFFKTKAEAEAERLRQITTLARHGREAVGLSPGELSQIIQARKKLTAHGRTLMEAAE